MNDLRCPRCHGELVEVDNPFRRETRHKGRIACPAESRSIPADEPLNRLPRTDVLAGRHDILAARHVDGPEPVKWQPARAPRGWQIIDRKVDGIAAVHFASGLRAILSAQTDGQGRTWVHLSVSVRTGRLPSWPELVSVRDAWLGGNVEAYQVAPPRDRYVNINPERPAPVDLSGRPGRGAAGLLGVSAERATEYLT